MPSPLFLEGGGDALPAIPTVPTEKFHYGNSLGYAPFIRHFVCRRGAEVQQDRAGEILAPQEVAGFQYGPAPCARAAGCRPALPCIGGIGAAGFHCRCKSCRFRARNLDRTIRTSLVRLHGDDLRPGLVLLWRCLCGNGNAPQSDQPKASWSILNRLWGLGQELSQER